MEYLLWTKMKGIFFWGGGLKSPLQKDLLLGEDLASSFFLLERIMLDKSHARTLTIMPRFVVLRITKLLQKIPVGAEISYNTEGLPPVIFWSPYLGPSPTADFATSCQPLN